MKFSSIISLGLPALALAAPTRTIEKKRGTLAKRASVTDAPETGYATENGGTTGGAGGSTTTVASFAEFSSAVSGDEAAIIIVDGALTGEDTVKVGSNKSIIGKDSGASLTGFGVTIKGVSNVILRNLAISKVVGGDAVAVQKATNVWIDHLDLSSDRDHDKDYYDGLLDITHAADFVTVSNTNFHDHWKCSLVGHSDNNGDEDTGHLRVTYHNNYWSNINSRGPSIRFGTGHIFNNYYENVSDGINTRDGAQVLVENNVFVGASKPLYSTDAGYAIESGNDFGGAEATADKGTLSSVPYTYTALAASEVKSAVVGTAGNTLSF
ncbi:polysaccharide lyase family 1 protein [Lophiostoma macrostomum CBS 122681]|uniref:pectate lyase n=1 Tax=Lophiostoma macrostomum CBS 122681 TaxID=1314788 RepID=A0A6A6TL53_9PLEO|nr:polysaccharide lyase family 1 protein [Lophiostoma macrostomum CBS 122681]